ncbi:MAG: peptidylprolyl isomerase [Bacteroidaceae bacterium]|nr:peptidylprolyl isomerase [Bacteroidaceae bacterium]
MRKQWILSAFLALGCTASLLAQDDAIIMNINGKDITKSEFEYIYKKNNKQQVEIKSLDEYIPLFVNYKLKVDAAERAGIDTTAAFVKELDGYRQELARPYLTDAATEEALLREAYDFYCKNVEISHILISVGQFPDAAQREAARIKAQEVADKALAGEDFEALAEQYSDDPGSKTRGGYLGYVRGGRLIYPFEKVAFNMQPGEISQPVETRFGYHIIKVHDVRADRGERLCAHIFLMIPQGASPEVEAQKKAEADAIYSDLMAGADFVAMAREKSQDQSNAMNGGELPWVSAGDLIKELEDAAFSLKKGEIAAPIRTKFGYHVVRLIDTRDVKSFDTMRSELAQRMSRDERGMMGRNALINQLKQQYNYQLDEVQLTAALTACGTAPDSTFLANMEQLEMTFATYADKSVTARDVANTMKSRRYSADANAAVVVKNEIDRIATAGLLDIEMGNLESKYPEYRNLINEYRDGMLLFEISNREVWEKASTDIKGLEKHFKKNKKKFAWERPRFKGYVVSCVNDSVAGEVEKIVKKNKNNREAIAAIETTFNNDSVTNVAITYGLYVEGDNKYVDELVFAGAKAQREENLPVVFVSGKTLKKPETYLDVRGQATADYQEFLEKQWIERLNKEATVVKYEDVLKTIN